MSSPTEQMAIRALSAGFLAFVSRDLITAWRWDPFCQSGALAFALWLVALVLVARRKGKAGSLWWPLGGVCLGAGSVLTDLSILAHLGLAICLAGTLVDTRTRLIALAGAAGWMPFIGWAGHSVAGWNPDPLRLPIAAATALLIFAVGGKAENKAAGTPEGNPT